MSHSPLKPWEKFKASGNDHFSKGQFEDALREYTRAIQHEPEQHVLFTNRSLTYLKLAKFQEARCDAEKAVGLAASNASVKAFYVLGRCHTEQLEYGQAIRAFKRCLDMVNAQDPSMSIYNDVFKCYFRARKLFYEERRATMVASMRLHVEECKSGGGRTVHGNEEEVAGAVWDRCSSLIEQLFSSVAETNRIGEEHGAVLRTTNANAGGSDFFHEIPDCFLCPISLEVMSDPVMVIGAADPAAMCSKQSYERSSIEKHFSINGPTDPIARFVYRPCPSLIPNLTLRTSIHCFLESHPWLYTD